MRRKTRKATKNKQQVKLLLLSVNGTLCFTALSEYDVCVSVLKISVSKSEVK